MIRRASLDGPIRSFREPSAIASLVEVYGRSAPDWHADAICHQTSPDHFFPPKGGSTAVARRVCWGAPGQPGCAARAECLKWALDNGERFGVWGGMTERERRIMLKKGHSPEVQLEFERIKAERAS